jgi:hypothetical protein
MVAGQRPRSGEIIQIDCFGIASVVAVSADWLFVILILVLYFINDRWANFFNAVWMNFLFWLAVAAALLAVTLEGTTSFMGSRQAY